jgi:hypothetical protein
MTRRIPVHLLRAVKVGLLPQDVERMDPEEEAVASLDKLTVRSFMEEAFIDAVT